MEAVLERSSALAVLHAAVADAVAGNGRVVLVSGEAGIGKTSLLRAFRAEQTADVRVLWGACDDLLTARTLGPLRDAAAGTSGPLAEALASACADEVFDAALSEFAEPGTQRRLTTVLVVEDLHWPTTPRSTSSATSPAGSAAGPAAGPAS
ncbi:ATP-binding protein [Flindersiella endophytica]